MSLIQTEHYPGTLVVAQTRGGHGRRTGTGRVTASAARCLGTATAPSGRCPRAFPRRPGPRASSAAGSRWGCRRCSARARRGSSRVDRDRVLDQVPPGYRTGRGADSAVPVRQGLGHAIHKGLVVEDAVDLSQRRIPESASGRRTSTRLRCRYARRTMAPPVRLGLRECTA